MVFSQRKEYIFYVPKIEKSFYDLSGAEAAEYFASFMEKVPERVEYLSAICARDLRIPIEKMDCSPESLVLLWKWFRKKAKTEPYAPSEEEKKSFIVITVKRKLTLETEYIIRDIGIYLGETFRKNCSSVYWTYYTEPRRDFFVNRPVIKGFTDVSTGNSVEVWIEPIHYTRTQAIKLLKNESSNQDLLKLYSYWASKA